MLPVPTGRDVLWTVLGTLAGTVVGLAAGVPVLLLGGLSYLAVCLATSTLGGLAGLWFALVRRRGWGVRELGFVACTRSAWHLLWEVPVALVAGLVCSATLGPALGLVPDGTGQDAVDGTLTAAPWSVVVGALCVVLLAPVLEEVVFRRVLLGWLRTRVPVGVAVVLVSAAFAATHVLPVLVLYTFFLGLSAALLVGWHRSLWASLALHATNNALACLLTVFAVTS
jgi:hypothetical protein